MTKTPSFDPENGFLPYSRPLVDEEDIEAVAASLRAPMISQGDRLHAFEQAFADVAGSAYAVAFSSGTAALHAMCAAAGIGEGDTVMVPALTFAGTVNAIRYCGATPIFVDIDPDSFCIEPHTLVDRMPDKCRAILGVDFAGLPVDYAGLRAVAEKAGALLLSDAAHAPGATYRGAAVGSLADMTAFSFNPVKNMTTAEGGMVTTDGSEAAERLRMFRVHGMTRERGRLMRNETADWYYEQQFLGMNYKLSEPHAALGLSQLQKLKRFNGKRQRIAGMYRERLAPLPLVLPPARCDATHVYHLFVIRIASEAPCTRDELFRRLRDQGIGVQLHYVPVPEHPYYKKMGYDLTGLDATSAYYADALSIPVHPAMEDADVDRVVKALERHLGN